MRDLEYQELEASYQCAKKDYKLCIWIFVFLSLVTGIIMGSTIAALYTNNKDNCEDLRSECNSICDLTLCSTCMHCNLTCNADICDNGCIHHKPDICKGKICSALTECVNCGNVYKYRDCDASIITYHNSVGLLGGSILIIVFFLGYSWYEQYPCMKIPSPL